MNAKLISLSLFVLTAIVGVALFVGESDANAQAVGITKEDGSLWDGAGFSVGIEVEGEPITIRADIVNDATSIEYHSTDNVDTTAITLSVGDKGYHYGRTTKVLDGVTYSFVLGCTEVDSISISELFPASSDIAMYNISFDADNDQFDLTSPDGKTITLPIANTDFEGTTTRSFVEITVGDETTQLKDMSFETNPAGTFDIPIGCINAWDSEANVADYTAYHSWKAAMTAAEGRRMLAQLDAIDTSSSLEDVESKRRLTTEIHDVISKHENVRRLSAELVDAPHKRNLWGAMLDELTIDMHYHRYCGPEINGCGAPGTSTGNKWWEEQGVSQCGGPRTAVDRCCAYHDHKCGYNEPDLADHQGGRRSDMPEVGSRGAQGSSKPRYPGDSDPCAFGFHHDTTACEHCACGGALAKCAKEATGDGSCYDGSECNAVWTATKVMAAFGFLPCWVTRTKWCGWHRCSGCSGCTGCGWRGCSGCSGCSGCQSKYCTWNDGYGTTLDKMSGDWAHSGNMCNNPVEYTNKNMGGDQGKHAVVSGNTCRVAQYGN